MEFAHEHEMVAPAERWLRSRGITTKREFGLPWGICDLVGCSLKKRSIKKRLALGQRKSVGPRLRIMVLFEIPDIEEGRAITLAELKSTFSDYLSENEILHEVNSLIRDRFVIEVSTRTYQKLNGWLPLHRKIVALELKLYRVNEALDQAINHLEFADESLVGLPMAIAKHVVYGKKKVDFLKHGIGILGVECDSCRLLLKSRPIRPAQNLLLQVHCSERFWRTLPKGSLA